MGCDVCLDSDYRLDASGDCLGVELDCPEHIAVVGYRDRVHTEVFAPRKELFEAYSAVEQRILAVQMKMSESFVVRHDPILYDARLVCY